MDKLSSTFAALADPTRRAILARLAEGSATVNELAEPFSISLPAVSRHLKVLEQAELISREAVAQKRRCTLRPENLRDAANWIEDHARFWTESLDRLDSYLDTIDMDTQTGEEAQDDRRSHGNKTGTADEK
ncbi:ArsR/SmtB family transcription factor [Aestuariispira ectoiniformans]|uniref:ArsR/SmtB family transcription factor n=1 Tax=Aestuariispira ectoiniformans TaxID=2775080 RepID=UPI00223B6558|nr:metalloregulator ArsR/SmtB family transcription factor [Aestuariispira ectoiniformans]